MSDIKIRPLKDKSTLRILIVVDGETYYDIDVEDVTDVRTSQVNGVMSMPSDTHMRYAPSGERSLTIDWVDRKTLKAFSDA